MRALTPKPGGQEVFKRIGDLVLVSVLDVDPSVFIVNPGAEADLRFEHRAKRRVIHLEAA